MSIVCFNLFHGSEVYLEITQALIWKKHHWPAKEYTFVSLLSLILFFKNSMFYQLLSVQHSCSSTQSWGSVLPSIVETRDQNSRGCPLLFSNRNLGSFCA